MSWLQRSREDLEGGDVEPLEPAGHRETERERQLQGLTVLSLFLHSVATIQEMMTTLLEHAPAITGATFVYPLLLDRKRQLLRASVLEGCADKSFEAAMDAFQEDLAALEYSLVQNAEVYRVLEEGEVATFDSLGVLMRSVMPEEQWQAGNEQLGIRHVALVPMVVENEPLGLVAFAFENRNPDVEALELLAGHLTLALRDLLVRDEAVRFSDVDPVTWVHNRRYLMQALENEIARAGRYGRSLSLITIDIDNFATFNESYGQSLGDRLLRTVATTLAEAVSPPELVARLKDDDFAVLLPETNRSAAVTAITRLLASLSRLSVFSAGDDSERVTASVAIACFPEDGSTPRQLLNRALADLEMAKRDRRGEGADDDGVARAAGAAGA
jgi:diguanylate cyclase (GGDEF)-like protein